MQKRNLAIDKKSLTEELSRFAKGFQALAEKL